MKKIFLSLGFAFFLLLFSCKNADENIAVVWSSKPELARYCEIFNSSQSKYKVIARYEKNPSFSLLDTKKIKEEKPDLVVDCWLKGATIRRNFITLNSLLGEKTDQIDPDIFYTELLDLGKENSDQLLLPISFNLPAIVFRDKAIKLENDFNISLETIKDFSVKYNFYEKNAYTKMGFAPVWNPEVLYLVLKGYDVDFEEKQTFFSWNESAIKEAITRLRRYTLETNTSSNAESDFQFKYLYDNPYSAIMSGRCLFQYLRSDELLMLNEEKIPNIDFRWLYFDKKTPLDDEIVYAGILKKAKNKRAAKAFLRFLISEEFQKVILAENTKNTLSSMGFGIVGGFSSVRNITENIFPKHYPILLSRLPQSKNFMRPHILPSNWLEIKREIIIPYLKLACEVDENDKANEFITLENYINKIKVKN